MSYVCLSISTENGVVSWGYFRPHRAAIKPRVSGQVIQSDRLTSFQACFTRIFSTEYELRAKPSATDRNSPAALRNVRCQIFSRPCQAAACSGSSVAQLRNEIASFFYVVAFPFTG